MTPDVAAATSREADRRIATIVATANRFARIMGGHFVIDPARLAAFRTHLLEKQNG